MITLSDINNALNNATPKERQEFTELFSQNYVSIEEYNELKASHIDSLELLANANKRITQLEAAIFAHDGQLPLPKF